MMEGGVTDWAGSGLSSSSVRGLMGPGFAADPAFATRYAPLSQGQRVAYVAYNTADQTGIAGADTGITGIGITFAAVAGRRYEMRYTFAVQQVTANGTATFQWMLASVAQGVIDISFGVAAAGRMVSGFVDLGVLGAGNKVIGLLARTNGGTLSINSNSWSPGRLSIIDVGT